MSNLSTQNPLAVGTRALQTRARVVYCHRKRGSRVDPFRALPLVGPTPYYYGRCTAPGPSLSSPARLPTCPLCFVEVSSPFRISSDPPPLKFRHPIHISRLSARGSDFPSARIASANPLGMQFRRLERKPSGQSSHEANGYFQSPRADCRKPSSRTPICYSG